VQENIEITGVDNDDENYAITGVHDENEDIAGDDDITGVHQNTENEENATEVHEDAENYEQTECHDIDDNEVSIENESNDDAYISIDDLITIEQLNTAQINMHPETGDELPKADERWRNITNHRYNLRPGPTHQNNKYTMTQDGQQSANKKLAKSHAHVMMTQMNIKQGIREFGEKGNEAILKESNQLHH